MYAGNICPKCSVSPAKEKAGSDCQERLVSLAECIKTWWEDHKYDACGDYGEHNVYDDEPKFVTLAKEALK